MIIEFHEFAIHGKLMKSESSDSELRSERYPYFKIRKKFEPKLGKNKEQNGFISKIKLLNLIQIQIFAR